MLLGEEVETNPYGVRFDSVELDIVFEELMRNGEDFITIMTAISLEKNLSEVTKKERALTKTLYFPLLYGTDKLEGLRNVRN